VRCFVFVSSGLWFKSHEPTPYRNNVPHPEWKQYILSHFHVLTHFSITYIIFTTLSNPLSSGYLPSHLCIDYPLSHWLASQACISLSALTFRPDRSYVFLPDEAYDPLLGVGYDFTLDLGYDFQSCTRGRSRTRRCQRQNSIERIKPPFQEPVCRRVTKWLRMSWI
jgi:hypothetical protein